MMKQSRILVFALGSLAALAATVGIVAASSDDGERAARSGGGGGGFDPGSLKGKWTGTWTNTTFGSTGSIQANVKFKQGKFIPLVNFGGNVFGCNDPAAESVTLKEGQGNNRWNNKGFNVSKQFNAFGDLELQYKHKTGKITGEGSAPPCNPAITYTVDGKLTKNKFTADVEIDLGTQTAEAKLTASKQ